MDKEQKRVQKNKLQREIRTRSVISGTAERPRLSVFRSNASFYIQLIDDEAGKTLASVNLKEAGQKGNKTEISVAAGTLIAKKASEKGIKQAVFDRGGNKYHGRIKAIAEAAREAGLKI